MADRPGWELLRVLTPILLALSIWIISDIRTNVISLESKFDTYVEHCAAKEVHLESRLTRLEVAVDKLIK